MGRLTNTDIRRAKVGGTLTPAKLAFKVLKLILDAHIKLDGLKLEDLPEGDAREEVVYRLVRLREVIDGLVGDAVLANAGVIVLPDPPLRRRAKSDSLLPVPPCETCGVEIEPGSLYQVIEAPSSGGRHIRATRGRVRCAVDALTR